LDSTCYFIGAPLATRPAQEKLLDLRDRGVDAETEWKQIMTGERAGGYRRRWKGKRMVDINLTCGRV